MKNAIKAMIELSNTPEEADAVIEEFTAFRSYEEKFAYVSGMFDAVVLAHVGDNSISKLKDDYMSILSAIVNQKWR